MARKGGIIIEWDSKKVEKMFGRMTEKLKEPQKFGLWKRLTMFLFMSWIAEAFSKSGRRRGHAEWVPLSPKYKAWKTSAHSRRGKKGTYGPYSGKPLIRLGHLQGSFLLGASGNVFKQGRTEMFFGTKIPYAQHHQDGTDRIPKREIVFITGRDEEEMSKEVSAWVMGRS